MPRIEKTLAISPDSQILVSGSSDDTIKIWDLASGELRHNLTNHVDAVNAVAIGPDGQTIISLLS